MASKRLFRAPFHLQGAFPRVTQQIHENVSTFSTTLLPEARATALVEFRVLSHRGGSLRQLRLLPLQNFLHLGNFVGGSVRGGTRCQRGLEQALQHDGEGGSRRESRATSEPPRKLPTR